MQNAVINLKESFISLCVFFSYCIALVCLKWSYTKQLVSAVTGFPPVLQILTQQRKLFRSDVEDESPEKKPDISSFAPQGFRTLVHTHFQESWMDLCWFVVLGFKTRLWLRLCCCDTHCVHNDRIYIFMWIFQVLRGTESPCGSCSLAFHEVAPNKSLDGGRVGQ